MLHSRYVPVLCALLMLAAIPTTIHSYLGTAIDDGLRASATSDTLLDMTSDPVDRRDRWVRNVYGSDDWTERIYQGPRGERIQLFVARSHDPKKLYHHPELGVAYSGSYTSSFRGDGIHTVRALDQDLPLHLLRGTGSSGFAAYALWHDGGFVRNPYLFQAQSALRLLVQPSRPLTLFFAHDRTADPAIPVDEAHATRLLIAAIGSFLEQQ